jgi:hypothetical protein
VRWAELERAQPRLAELGRRLLVRPGVLLLVTIRRDGTPRLSPVEPLLMDGELWLSMLLGSAKAQDLLRDGRILVHNIVTGRDGADGEFKVRGTARMETDPAIHRAYARRVTQTLDRSPEVGQFHLFAVRIQTVAYVNYEDGDQYLTMWPLGRESVRRKATASGVGASEPARRLLMPG